MSAISPVVGKPSLTVSPDVYEYTSKHGIEAPLVRLLAVTPRVFPTAESIQVYLKQDVSIEDLWFVTFEVRVPAGDIPDYVQAKQRWGEEWERAYPSPRSHSFVLRMIPV